MALMAKRECCFRQLIEVCGGGKCEHLAMGRWGRSGIDVLAVPSNLMVGSPQAEHRIERIRQQLHEDLNGLRQERSLCPF